MIVAKNATNQSAYFNLQDGVTGGTWATNPSPTTDFNVIYQRDQAAQVLTGCPALLAAANSAHEDNKIFNCGNGLWRVDFPDAAFATGVDHVQLMVTEDNVLFLPAVVECDLSPHVEADSGTITTLTNLPAAPPDWIDAASVEAATVTKIQSGLATPTNITAATGIVVSGLAAASAAKLDDLLDGTGGITLHGALAGRTHDSAIAGNTWFVDGTNGNAAYSGKSPIDAKATIAQAITLAASGDTMMIAAGTYAESTDLKAATKSLRLIGAGIGVTNITGDGINELFNCYDDCEIGCMSITSATRIGIFAAETDARKNIFIHDCDIDVSQDGIRDTGGITNMRIENCRVKCDYDGIAIEAGNWLIRNCWLESDGSYGDANHCRPISIVGGNPIVVVENTKLWADKAVAGAEIIAPLYAERGCIILRNCDLYGRGSHANITSPVCGIRTKKDSGTYDTTVLVENCRIYTSTIGSGGSYDLYTSAGAVDMVITNTRYDRTKVSAASATIIDCDSKNGYALAADGLDTLPITSPTGVATTFRGMVVQLFLRFFGRNKLVKGVGGTGTATTYENTGVTPVTEQAVTDDGTTQQWAKAEDA